MSAFLDKHKDKWHVSETGCWIWTAANIRGYGVCWDGEKVRLVSRMVCEEKYGPSELEASHTCQINACVNPNHIEWETRYENEGRKNPKGYSFYPNTPKPYRARIGRKDLGCFSTEAEARAAYLGALSKLA